MLSWIENCLFFSPQLYYLPIITKLFLLMIDENSQQLVEAKKTIVS